MDFEPIKKFFSLFLTALGLFVFIAIIYSVILVSQYALKKPEKISESFADEAISIFPSLKLERIE